MIGSWIGRPVESLDTPALVIDLEKVEANIERMATRAREANVDLRPHTKTHKLPALAHNQLTAGAIGITVAKLGEAEVMAQAGIRDIFVANQIVGPEKMRRVRSLARQIRVSVAIDHPEQIRFLNEAFRDETQPIDVLIEIDTGQRRGGLVSGDGVAELAQAAKNAPGVYLKGIYTHEGHDYDVPDKTALKPTSREAQEVMLAHKRRVEQVTNRQCYVSIGSTPSLQGGADILPGIDELRPGTYIFNDASQALVIGHYDWCAAWVMATVTSRPNPDRTVLDAGTKALTSDRRGPGVLHTQGYGYVVGHPTVSIARLSDEHGVIEGEGADGFSIGDVVRVIPNHICPVVNLFDKVFVSRNGYVEGVWTVQGRGRSQ